MPKKPVLKKNGFFVFPTDRYPPCDLGLTRSYALCAKRYASVRSKSCIAPIEDLRAAQKEGVNIYAMHCALLCALWKWRRIGWRNVCKLWLEESTPEELKGRWVNLFFMKKVVLVEKANV